MGAISSIGWLIVGLIVWAIVFTGDTSLWAAVAGYYSSDPNAEGWIVWVLTAIPLVIFVLIVYTFWRRLGDNSGNVIMQ